MGIDCASLFDFSTRFRQCGILYIYIFHILVSNSIYIIDIYMYICVCTFKKKPHELEIRSLNHLGTDQ